MPSVGIFIGITTSTPYGLPSVLSSSQVSVRVELVGVVEPHAAEHAEPAGARDRGGDVLGRGEGEDRVLDAELVAERRCAWSGSCRRRGGLASSGELLGPGYCALPVALRGISVDERQRRAAACSRRGARAGTSRSSSSSTVAPSRGWTTAATAWPYFSSGTPTTSTSYTAGWRLDRHLDLFGVDLLPAGVDAVGAAAEQRDLAVLLDPGEVAGHRVARAVDLEEGRAPTSPGPCSSRPAPMPPRAEPADLADVGGRVEHPVVVVEHHAARRRAPTTRAVAA